jgi:putative photosynthetic complex assembly protein 2
VARARHRTTPGGAVESFVGGALLWTAAAGALYGGWIVGAVNTAPAASLAALTLQAVLATWHNDAFTLLLGLAAWRLTRGAANRVGVSALALFWLVHAVAKVNVFVGVANPGAHYLPDYLWHLHRYFGPERNSLLLPITVVGCVLATLWLGWRAWRAPAAWRRTEAALLATVMALSALETGVLGVVFDLGAWDVFLRLRAGP